MESSRPVRSICPVKTEALLQSGLTLADIKEQNRILGAMCEKGCKGSQQYEFLLSWGGSVALNTCPFAESIKDS